MAPQAQRFSSALLKELRNRIPINLLITSKLNIPAKQVEGYLRFLCPLCHEFNTATNPKTNLSRCFSCRKNFNPIDIVIAYRKCSFIEAVRFLKSILASQR